MTARTNTRPFLVLVDDDYHSARLMLRMLDAHGGPEVTYLSDAEAALEALAGVASVPRETTNTMVIVDLKASSAATRQFIERLVALAPTLLVVAMAPTLDKPARDELLNVGAAAVFERHADLGLYRREAANIVSFWARNQRLNAVGT